MKRLYGGLRISSSIAKESTPNQPLVSIVTVVRNGEGLLEDTIKSVLDQTYENIEFLVIDGASTDGTIALLREYESRLDYWVSEPDHGIYDAMNKGVRNCKGELVGIIGAGDWYELNAIECVVDEFLRTQADVVFGDVEMVDGETGISQGRKSQIDLMPLSMASISHPSTFTRREIYNLRPFDVSFKIAADYDLFLHLYVSGFHFQNSNSLITHILSGGVSGSWATLAEVYKIHRKHYGAVRASIRFISSTYNYVFYNSRRWALKKMLTPRCYLRLRTLWLRNKLNERKT